MSTYSWTLESLSVVNGGWVTRSTASLSPGGFGLFWDDQSGAADLAVSENDLASGTELQTAILLSLFTDRRLDAGDPLPDGETDRRGWWGDAHPVVEGDRMGSRLWLLARSKETQEFLTLAEEYARESLAWLLEDKVSDQIDVTASVVERGRWSLSVVVYRPIGDPAEFKFNLVWASQEASL